MREENKLEKLVGRIATDHSLHARWLNTFSFLEYIGFRKIVKSQRAEALDAAILGHACEEGRHALGLKKLAIKLGGPEFDSYLPETLLCGEEAKNYFQELDKRCDDAFVHRSDAERARLTYGYVTWLVERRALDVYEHTNRLLEIRKLGVGSRACWPRKQSTFQISMSYFRQPIQSLGRAQRNSRPRKLRSITNFLMRWHMSLPAIRQSARRSPADICALPKPIF
jgi:hypothetical protein